MVGQFDWFVVEVDLVCSVVELEVVDLYYFVGLFVCMLQQYVVVCFEFVEIEWFVEVVVGVDVQCLYVIFNVIMCGQYQYWCVVVVFVYVGQYVQVIEFGQVDVQYYQVEVLVVQYVGGGQVISLLVYGVFVMVYLVDDCIGQIWVVFDQQQVYGYMGGRGIECYCMLLLSLLGMVW